MSDTNDKSWGGGASGGAGAGSSFPGRKHPSSPTSPFNGAWLTLGVVGIWAAVAAKTRGGLNAPAIQKVTPQMLSSARREGYLNDRWIQGVDEEMEEHHTVGAFGRQARAAGYDDTMDFACKVMQGWDSGKKKVWNKKKKKFMKISLRTMRRANFALNVNPEKPCPA